MRFVFEFMILVFCIVAAFAAVAWMIAREQKKPNQPPTQKKK